MKAATATHTSTEKRLSTRLMMAYRLSEMPAFWSALALAGVSCQGAQSEPAQMVCSYVKYTGMLAKKNVRMRMVRVAHTKRASTSQ
jgi:hypothetical protein